MLTRIVILGGGITGLSAAHYARRQLPEAEITLVERAPRWGGKLVSERVPVPGGECLIEGGAESFVTRKPEVWDLAHELDLGERIVPAPNEARRIAVLDGGQLRRVPLDPVTFVKTPLLSARGKLRMLAEPFVPAQRDPAADESLAAFVDRRLGREAREKFIGPILGGIYNTDPEAQSVLTTAPVMRDLEAHGSLVRGSLARMRQRRRGPRRPAFISFAGGAQELVDALVRTERVTLLSGVGARAIVREGPGWRVLLEDGASLPAEALVLAMPAHAAARVLAGVAPEAAVGLRAIRHSHIGTLSLVYRAGDLPPSELRGVMIPRRERRPIDALTQVRAPHPRVAAGHAVIKLFFGGGDPRTAELDDDALLAVARDELARLLGVTAAPAAWRAYRWRDDFPQADVGHLDRVAAIERALPRGIVLAGAAYRGLGVPDCIRQAREAVRVIHSQALVGAQ